MYSIPLKKTIHGVNKLWTEKRTEKNIDRSFIKLRIWTARCCIPLIQMLIIAFQGWMGSIFAALLIRESLTL